MPTGNGVNKAALLAIVMLPESVQLSVAVGGVSGGEETQPPSSTGTVISPNSGSITGAKLSISVMVCEQVLVYSVPPMVCLAVHVTVVVPLGNDAPLSVVLEGAET